MFPVALTVSFPSPDRAEFVARVRSWNAHPAIDHVYVAEGSTPVRTVLFITGGSPAQALELARHMANEAMSDLGDLRGAVVDVHLLTSPAQE